MGYSLTVYNAEGRLGKKEMELLGFINIDFMKETFQCFPNITFCFVYLKDILCWQETL